MLDRDVLSPQEFQRQMEVVFTYESFSAPGKENKSTSTSLICEKKYAP